MTTQTVLLVIFVLFLATNGAYLHRVPGLLGDEASEGENVWQLLHEGPTLIGERSYIGPGIDYVRVPFVWVFGYSVLALRVVMLLVSAATFWLAWAVLRQHFDESAALTALVFMVFSPIYLVYQRLGWAITLLPFFAWLILWLAGTSWRWRWPLVGLAAGLGLSSHILFAPVLAGLLAGSALWALSRLSVDRLRDVRGLVGAVKASAAAVIGFGFGFGPQLYVLLTWQEDQGDVSQTTQLFAERLQGLVDVLPLTISGSSYVARYTGVEFSLEAIWVVVSALAGLVLAGMWLRGRSIVWWSWVGGLIVHLMVLVWMIDRFTLRYFVVTSLGMWLLAGMGFGELLEKVVTSKVWQRSVVTAAAVVLIGWTTWLVLLPFLQTGGDTAEFSIGNRTNRAAAFVDEREMVACLRGAGAVFTENVHIWNRLRYLSRGYSDLAVLDEEIGDEAEWLVHYRLADGSSDDCESAGAELCPDLAHFCVVPAEGT